MPRSLLGEILVKRSCLTQEQLDDALQKQKAQEDACVIGDILLRQGLVDERDILIALMVQCGLPYIAVNKYAHDPEIARIIPQEIARLRNLVAFNRIGNVLSVAMVGPLDQTARAELEDITKCKLAVFVSTKAQIEDALGRLY